MKRFGHVVANFAVATALALPVAAWAAGGSRVITVVYKNGHAASLRMNAMDAFSAAAGPCGDTEHVLFAFGPPDNSAGSMQRDLHVVISQSDTVEVELLCTNLSSGSAQISFKTNPDAQEGDFSFIGSSSAQFSLAPESLGGQGGVTVQIDPGVVDSSFDVVRFSGSYQGVTSSGEYVGGPIAQNPNHIFKKINIIKAELPAAGQPPAPIANDPAADPAYGSISNACQNNSTNAINAMCQSLLEAAAAEGNPEADKVLVNNITQTAPYQTTGIANSAGQVVMAQASNIAMRMSNLLAGGGGGFSASGLRYEGSSGTLSLGDMVGALQATDDNEQARTLLGGTRWGFWLNGVVGGGKRDSLARGDAGFRFDTQALTAGIDYRFSDRAFAGAAVGYSQLDSDFARQNGSLDASSWSLHGYTGYAVSDSFHIDGSASWLRSDYRQNRVIRLLKFEDGQASAMAPDSARGDTSANQKSVSIGGSWNISRGAWTVSPQFQYQWTASDIDGFEESGCPLYQLCLEYGSQHIVTRSLSAGVYVDRVVLTGAGAFKPYFRALLYKDGGTGTYDLVARFAQLECSPVCELNGVVVTEPDRDYATVELGTSFSRPLGTRTVDFNFGVLSLVGFTALDRWSLRADVRIPF